MNQLRQRVAAPQIITVAGHIGSGKSEVCRELHNQTGWPVLSTGALFRKIAAEHRMSVLALNEHAEAHREIDDEVDAYLRNLAENPQAIIVDSRMAWHFLPASLKVYLVVDPDIAAARIFNAQRADERYTSTQDAVADNEARQRIENERYRVLYGVQCDHWRNYDGVFDTSYATPSRIAELVLAATSQDSSSESANPVCWLAPRRLIPTQDIRELARGSALAVEADVKKHGYTNTDAVDVVVYEGRYLILDGHVRVSAAIRTNEMVIRCRLAAFQQEEVSPGLSVLEFAETSTSLSRIYDWEEANGFRFSSYPDWLNL